MLNVWSAVGRVSSKTSNRTSTGTLYIKFTLAVQREKQKNETEAKTDFISCAIIGKGGEYFEKYIEKGDTISVTGPMQSGQYEKNGQTVNVTECFVTKYDFITKPKQGVATQQTAPVSQPAPVQQTIQAPPGYMAQIQPNGQVNFVPIPQSVPPTPPPPTVAPPEEANLPFDIFGGIQ